MPVVKCNHNPVRPFEIILQILDLGHFQCSVLAKKICKEKQSLNTISIKRTEYIEKEQLLIRTY